MRLRVELEKQHITILDDIFLAFVARLAGLLGRRFTFQRDIVVIGNGLRPDEAAFKIGVDDPSGLRRLGAGGDGPGARFFGPAVK